MTNTQLTEAQVHDVLIRAGEIDQRDHSRADVRQILEAAEEAGLSKNAVRQAMQEHLDLVGEPPAVGDLVFAKSTDGKFHVARILQMGEGAPRVRFLNGGEVSISPHDLRPLSICPGTKLVCKWPSWGDWTCTVLRFDSENSLVRVTDGWGSEATFPLAEVQLDLKQFAPSTVPNVLQDKWQLVAINFIGGGILGSIVTWLILR